MKKRQIFVNKNGKVEIVGSEKNEGMRNPKGIRLVHPSSRS